MKWNDDTHLRPSERLVYSSRVAKVGRFTLGPDDADFQHLGPIHNHVIVFRRRPLWERDQQRSSYRILDPLHAIFYPRGQELRRQSLGDSGDVGAWIALRPDLLEGILASSHGPPGLTDLATSKQCVLRLSAPLLRRAWTLLHRLSDSSLDTRIVDNELLDLAGRVFAGASQVGDEKPQGVVHLQLAERAAAIIAQAPEQERGIESIASELGVSMYHLCRVFRRLRGQTLHQYRLQQRLARALDRLLTRPGNLTHLALDLGFSSHSHFTDTFSRIFEVPPSRI